MAAIKVGQDKVGCGRYHQRLGEMLGIPKADERLSLLLDGEGFDGPESRMIVHAS